MAAVGNEAEAPAAHPRRRCRKRPAALALAAATAATAGLGLLAGTAEAGARLPPRRRRAADREVYRRLWERQRRGRRLGVTHKKGRSSSSEDADVGGTAGFGLPGGRLGGEPEQPEPPAAVAPLPNDSGGGGGGGGSDPPPDPTLATNLLKFTRSGDGDSYPLPPSDRHPYLASLQLEGHSPTLGPYDAHVCTGVLIAPDLVLTAAHCKDYSPPGSDEVFRAFNGMEVGKVDLSYEGPPYDPYDSDTNHLYYENLVPEKMMVHPNYDPETYERDLMVVKAYGTSRFPPAKVAREVESKRATMLGWGASSATSSQKYSNELRSGEMELMTNGQCRDLDVSVTDPNTDATTITSLENYIYDDMMCAYSTARYACYGDAGGPAVSLGEDSDADEVAGIMSWGYGCVNPDYPAVFARVAEEYDWIRGKVCAESADPPEWYGCPQPMTAFSSSTQTTRVTLEIALDMASEETGFVVEDRDTGAVETGFVVEDRDTGAVVAQRQTGHYRNERWHNRKAREALDLPRDRCYKLVMIDSFGDGFCCDQGGQSAIVYWGTDTSHYTGIKLAEVKGNFEFERSADFCAIPPAGEVQSMSNYPPAPGPTPPAVPKYVPPYDPHPPSSPPPPASAPRPVEPQVQAEPDPNSSWTGPANSPEFEYCHRFCSDGSGLACGNHECRHDSDALATDSEEEDPAPPPEELPEDLPLISKEFYEADAEHFVTVRFRFDERPQEVSWVLYDLTANEVKAFVDFDVYPPGEYAGKTLDVIVSVPGPEDGEKRYAFTAYDRASNGLCCAHGEGYYKVFLGDPGRGGAVDLPDGGSDAAAAAEALELLGDAEYGFSSSYYFALYYFALFEDEDGLDEAAVVETSAPVSAAPTGRPTARPTFRPTAYPTASPTREPTPPPTTARPTQIWELQRPEDADEVGARWSMRGGTAPGVFHDTGGDQGRYRLDMERIKNGAIAGRGGRAAAQLVGVVAVVGWVFF
ncbi:hypothetical protein ACHAWF_011397 [Thalassiosira exigua]